MTQSPASRWLRLAHTPFSDVLRGRFTASLDWRGTLRGAQLPSAVEALLTTVIDRTRLWRTEKTEVTHELVAHFHDGLAQERTASQLIADFGDPFQAARLIRRAKKRNRPWHWKVRHRAAQAGGLLVLFYLGTIAATVSRHPSPAVDYLAQLNATALAAPEAEGAWPLYRRLWSDYAQRGMDARQVEARPGDSGWEAVREKLTENAAWLGDLRKAAARPALGLPIGFSWDFSPEDAQVLLGNDWIPGTPPAADDPNRLEDEWLGGVLLPHFAKLKAMALWLAADLAAAAENGEGQRVVANYQAIVGVARQCREHPFLIGQLVSIAAVNIGNGEVARVLQQYPESLTGAELTQLAHALAASADQLGVDFDGEGLMFEDLVQRVYSDDGHGDGRVTLEGMRLLRRAGLDPGSWLGERDLNTSVQLFESTDLVSRAASAAIAPVAVQLLASRRELLTEYHRLMSLLETAATQPLWVQLREPSEAERQLAAIRTSPAQNLRYLPITMLRPNLSKAGRESGESLAFNESLMVATALEVYRRHNGAYPDTLDELAPRWLPRVPRDASTGHPLLYRIVEGRPVIYGRGWNGQDDGGRMTAQAAKVWPKLASEETDAGDWVLYPPPPADRTGGGR